MRRWLCDGGSSNLACVRRHRRARPAEPCARPAEPAAPELPGTAAPCGVVCATAVAARAGLLPGPSCDSARAVACATEAAPSGAAIAPAGARAAAAVPAAPPALMSGWLIPRASRALCGKGLPSALSGPVEGTPAAITARQLSVAARRRHRRRPCLRGGQPLALQRRVSGRGGKEEGRKGSTYGGSVPCLAAPLAAAFSPRAPATPQVCLARRLG
jgi:hypothetical protein